MIDWTQWPLLRVRATDLPAEQARQETGRALEEALACGGPFAAVVEMPSTPRGRVRGAMEQVRMVRRLRPGLAERCRGLAFVISTDAQHKNAKQIKSGAKVWGCPRARHRRPRHRPPLAREQLTGGDR